MAHPHQGTGQSGELAETEREVIARTLIARLQAAWYAPNRSTGFTTIRQRNRAFSSVISVLRLVRPALSYEPGGRTFESCWAHHNIPGFFAHRAAADKPAAGCPP